jgi:hypothetical protein
MHPVVPFLGAYGQPQGEPSCSTSTTSPQLHARSSGPYCRQYGLPSTAAPLAPSPNNATLENLHVYGSHSQGYRNPVSHKSAATSLHSQQQPQRCVPIPSSFTSGNMAAPTTHANGMVGPLHYGRPLSSPMYAFQPHTSLALVSPATDSFPTSITTWSQLTVPPIVDTLNPDSGDGRGRNLQLSTSSDPLLEMDEDLPLPPPAAPCPPPRKPRSNLRKVMGDVTLQSDIKLLLQRLKEQGGDEDAIARVPIVFENGVSKNALKLRRRKTGGKSMNFDQGYMNFVGRRQVKKENNMGEYYENEWWCRLCPRENRKFYVAFKNLQPHLCSKHFGLPSRGKISGVSPYNAYNQLQTLTAF